MKFLKDILDKQKHLFEKGGKLSKFHSLWDAQYTFLFWTDTITKRKGVQVRDAIDLKRMMFTVVIAMIPCLLFGIWNVGDQHFKSVGEVATEGQKWLLGLRVVLPIVLVSYVAGGLVEVIIGIIKDHPINEGFLVTGMLIPLVMPPTIPLWQVALASVFAVLIGKEVFGGTGMNVLNVALTARAFLYFAYPTEISGDVWVYKGGKAVVDGYTGATPLSIGADAASNGYDVFSGDPEIDGAYGLDTYGTSIDGNAWNEGVYDFSNMLLGNMPGSIGETSTLMALIGAAILILTGVGSWKIITSVFGGAFFMALLMNLLGSNEFMILPAEYHLVIGGLAFGAAFMATDPVTATQTERGKWFYGFLIGVLTIIIRVWNPAYPEGIMLAILLMNVFAPLIDYFVINVHKKRRLSRAAV